MLLFGPGAAVLLLEAASCMPRRLTQPRAVLRRVRRKPALRDAAAEAVSELFEDSSWHTLDRLCAVLMLAVMLAALLALAGRSTRRNI
jgi:hypothetical protein